MKPIALSALALLSFAAAPLSQAAIYGSALTPEVSGATGSGMVELDYDPAAHTLKIDASFAGLSGTTTVAHIHCCTAAAGTGAAGVAVTPTTLPGFPAGAYSGTYSYTVDLSSDASYAGTFLTGAGGTAALAEMTLIAGLDTGKAYFNVHTSTFPGGEIRGFPSPIPEPASVALMLAGLLGVGAAARRRTRD